MNIVPDKKYIITIVIASLILCLLPQIRTQLGHPRTINLISENDPKEIELKRIPESDSLGTVLGKIYGKGSKIVMDDENRLYLMEAKESIPKLILQLLCSFLFIFLLFLVNYRIARPKDKFKKATYSGLIFAIIATLGSAYILSNILSLVLSKLIPGTPLIIKFLLNPAAGFIMSMIVLGASFYARLNFQKQHVELENEKLKRESLQSQFESLKNQVSPHFLFNSLNALQTLIREEPQTANQYVTHLSLVLRYTLQSSEKETVYLAEEMKFVDSYIFLLRMRYDSNLIIKTSIPDDYLSYSIPPFTVQTLIENAVKHNEISKRNPLTIDINANKTNTLTVTNNLQKKITMESGTGIGLSNISQRYRLLTGKDIIITRGNSEFSVEIPLLNNKP